MKKILFTSIAALFLCSFSLNDTIEITIDIAPNVLNIGSSGTVYTVHTDIEYWLVDFDECYLNGILIKSWKSDDRGFFVAKFDINAVKNLDGLKIGEMNTFTMIGKTNSGEDFIGSQDIMVINVVPKGGR